MRRFDRDTGTFARRGSALITAIVFALIVALTLAGVGTLTVSHYSLAHAESDSTAALDLAEAGINYELTRITNNVADADPPNNNYQPASNIDASLRGTFYVRCTPQGATTTTWDPKASGGMVQITCTGVINGARRSVSIDAQPSGTFYTAYASGTSSAGGKLTFQGDNDVVSGLVGTDGKLGIAASVSDKPKVTGVVFNGPNAGWTGNKDPGGYNSVVNPNAVPWTPINQKIAQASAGMAGGLAANNDNALATYEDGSPAIVGNQLNNAGTDPGHLTVTLRGKPAINGVVQTANYYLTTLSLTGTNTDLVFDNSAGPINVYYVASQNSQSAGGQITGGHILNDVKTTPGHNVDIFSSSPGSLILSPNSKNDPVELGVYAYETTDDGGSTSAYGTVNVGPNLNFTGQIIANKINIYKNVQITGERGFFDIPQEYYAFSGNWQELAGDGSSNTYGGANQ